MLGEPVSKKTAENASRLKFTSGSALKIPDGQGCVFDGDITAD